MLPSTQAPDSMSPDRRIRSEFLAVLVLRFLSPFFEDRGDSGCAG